jgi:nitrogen regulatory protein P-II 1
MKLIKCIIRQDKLSAVIEKLADNVPGLTVSEVRGHGRQKGHSAVYRGVEYSVDLLPKTMIETVVDDSRVEDVINLVRNAAMTGQIGDGRIFIVDVEESYHVRTGFMDR